VPEVVNRHRRQLGGDQRPVEPGVLVHGRVRRCRPATSEKRSVSTACAWDGLPLARDVADTVHIDIPRSADAS
jgi:hypothetical protein